jgi:hypothetical protein
VVLACAAVAKLLGVAGGLVAEGLVAEEQKMGVDYNMEDSLDTAQHLLVSYIGNSFGIIMMIQDSAPLTLPFPEPPSSPSPSPISASSPSLQPPSAPSFPRTTTFPDINNPLPPQPELQMSTLFLLFKVPLYCLPYIILFVSLFPVLVQWNRDA